MPRETVDYVGYFTAPVNKERSEGQSDRQRAYLYALESLPQVEVVLGYFRWVHHKGTAHEDRSGPYTKFWHWEEKGSDVNLAMAMVRDACLKRFDKMVLISNDSDLAGPVGMVVNDFDIPVFQVSPAITTNKAFIGVATHCMILQTKRLSSCLLPRIVALPDGGQVTCPSQWI